MRAFVLCATILSLPSFAVAQELPNQQALMNAPFQHESEHVVPVKPFMLKGYQFSSLLATEPWLEPAQLHVQDEQVLTLQVLSPNPDTARFHFGVKLIVPIMKAQGDWTPILTEQSPTNPYAFRERRSKGIVQVSGTWKLNLGHPFR